MFDCSGLGLRLVGLPGAIHGEGEDNHPAAVASWSSPLSGIVKVRFQEIAILPNLRSADRLW
ncbi:hypothetical protein T07_8376 [Trichinella nelsoni]|uniref:Uncharacterized protein n=1 Tax=Trichinella nelsoni TaxID=6336 RepID=A0A0V0RP47_9BILA|nr:hypothetical protein T07_8376 [Trichinella nelsoni]